MLDTNCFELLAGRVGLDGVTQSHNSSYSYALMYQYLTKDQVICAPYFRQDCAPRSFCGGAITME